MEAGPDWDGVSGGGSAAGTGSQDVTCCTCKQVVPDDLSVVVIRAKEKGPAVFRFRRCPNLRSRTEALPHRYGLFLTHNLTRRTTDRGRVRWGGVARVGAPCFRR